MGAFAKSCTHVLPCAHTCAHIHDRKGTHTHTPTHAYTRADTKGQPSKTEATHLKNDMAEWMHSQSHTHIHMKRKAT